MRYYVQYNELNQLITIGTGYGGTEITKEEYDTLLLEIRTKATLINQLYNNEISISDVPTDWQEEIQRRVGERITEQGVMNEQPISTDEFYAMLEEVL